MSVTLIKSDWVSGNLVFYEDAVGQSVTGDVLTIGTTAVKVGGTSQDVDFQFYATGGKSFIIDAGAGTMTLTGIKLGSQLYANLTGTDYTILKIHNHSTTAEIGGAEFKGELVNASGAVYGVYNTWNYSPTGLTGTSDNVSAAINVMAITTGHTVTAGNIYGLEAHVQLAGTLNGAAVNAIGVNGVLSGAGANTEVLHMAGVASSMSTGLVNPTTGTLSYYLANSLSTVVVDNLICSLQSQYVTTFVSFDAAASGKAIETSVVAVGSGSANTSHALHIKIGAADGYIPVYANANFTA